MNRAAIYLRLTSVSPQPESQIDQLRKAAKERGLDVVAEYSDRVWRPADRRPGLNDLLFNAKKGKFDHVIVYSLADISRSLKHGLEVVVALNNFGINIVSLRDALDIMATPGEGNALMVKVLHQLQRTLLGETVKAGMRRSKLDGIPMGRRPVAMDRTSILRDRDSGMSLACIGRKHGVSKATVYKVIAEARTQESILISAPARVDGGRSPLINVPGCY
jgi:DNA invertase Pin-like site-specific DNA recombinase